MAADLSKPVLTDGYAGILQTIRDNQALLASWGNTGVTGTQEGAKRWSDANSRFEKYDGGSWGELVSQYNINVAYLGGNSASFYRNASNLNAGTVPVAQLPQASTSARGAVQMSNDVSEDSSSLVPTSAVTNSIKNDVDGLAALRYALKYHALSEVIVSNFAQDTWVEIGKTGSGADYELAQMNNMPAGVRFVIVNVYIGWEISPAVEISSVLEAYLYTQHPDANRAGFSFTSRVAGLARGTVYADEVGSGYTRNEVYTQALLPVDDNGIFLVRWDKFSSSGNPQATVKIALLGWL